MPAGRAFVLLGAFTALLAVSALEPRLATLVLLLDVLLVAAIAVDYRRATRVHVVARRVFPPLLVQGAAQSVETRLSADRAARVLAREALHPALSVGPRRRDVKLAPGHEAVLSFALAPRRRGEHRFGPLTLRILGPWGLAWAQREALPSEARRVYPQLRYEGRVGRLLALAQRRELGRSPLRQHGVGSEPYALRDYRPGDPPTKIHWKATARRGRLISREDAWERGGRVTILLDCARAMASLDGARSKLDYALAAALALTRVAVSRGDRVTLVAFSNRIEKRVRAQGGARALVRVYAALFDLEARLVEPAFDLATESVLSLGGRRSTVVVMTSVVDLAATDLLHESLLRLARRHRPLLVNLEDPEIARLARGVPETRPEAFAKASALEILLANRRLVRLLARQGIRATTAPADQLAWETLDLYLSLFRRRRGGICRPGAAPV